MCFEPRDSLGTRSTGYQTPKMHQQWRMSECDMRVISMCRSPSILRDIMCTLREVIDCSMLSYQTLPHRDLLQYLQKYFERTSVLCSFINFKLLHLWQYQARLGSIIVARTNATPIQRQVYKGSSWRWIDTQHSIQTFILKDGNLLLALHHLSDRWKFRNSERIFLTVLYIDTVVFLHFSVDTVVYLVV